MTHYNFLLYTVCMYASHTILTVVCANGHAPLLQLIERAYCTIRQTHHIMFLLMVCWSSGHSLRQVTTRILSPWLIYLLCIEL